MAHGTKQDGVRATAGVERVRGKCVARIDIVLRPRRVDRRSELPAQPGLERFQDLERGVSDFEADTVTGQHRDFTACQGNLTDGRACSAQWWQL